MRFPPSPRSYIFNKQGRKIKTDDGRSVMDIVKNADGFAGGERAALTARQSHNWSPD